MIAGQRTKITPRNLGCSKRHVWRLGVEPATRLLVSEIFRPYSRRLMEMTPQVNAVVGDALRAMANDKADHLTRLRAVERYCELLEVVEGEPQ